MEHEVGRRREAAHVLERCASGLRAVHVHGAGGFTLAWCLRQKRTTDPEGVIPVTKIDWSLGGVSFPYLISLSIFRKRLG